MASQASLVIIWNVQEALNVHATTAIYEDPA